MTVNFIAWKKRVVIIGIFILFLGLIPNLLADTIPVDSALQTSLKPDISENEQNGLTDGLITDSDTHQVLKIQGMEYYDQELFDLALESFEKAESLSPSDPEMAYLLGITHFMLGNMSEAELLLNRSLLHNPDPSAFFYHGLSAYTLRQYNQSVNSFQRYLTYQPEDSHAWFNLGQAYEELGLVAEAITAYKSALSVDPEYAKPWFFIGTTYYSHGYNKDAKEAILNYTRMMPDDDTGWFFLSSLHFQGGERNESIAALNKAIAIKPDEPLYQNYLSQYERNAGTEKRDHASLLQTPLSPFLGIYAIVSLICITRIRR